MKPTDTIIRDATSADVPAIFAILNQEIVAGVDTFKIEERTPDQQRAWWNDHQRRGYPVLVVDADGTVAGWASLSAWNSAVEGYRYTAEVSIWVQREFRGRGLGRALLEELLQCGIEMELRVLIAKIEATNQSSLALHEACGFSEVGVMHCVGEKFGRELDVAILEFDLMTL